MRLFESQTFADFEDRDSEATLSDLEFRNCTFKSCLISMTRTPTRRTTIRNARLINCIEFGCSLETALIEDVLVDGLVTNGDTLITGAVAFKHVALRGRIEYLMTSPLAFLGILTPEEQRAFDEANSAYYEHVDWALDVSQGEFKDLEIRGVPAGLVRRDPDTQIVITRAKALEGKWQDLPFTCHVTKTAIDWFLRRGEPDYVYVAPKRNSWFRDRLADIRLLRKAGIAEPD